MAAAAVGTVFIGPADVVQDGGQTHDEEIGLLPLSDAQAETKHAFGMVPIVAAPGIVKARPGLGPDGLRQSRPPCRVQTAASILVSTTLFAARLSSAAKPMRWLSMDASIVDVRSAGSRRLTAWRRSWTRP